MLGIDSRAARAAWTVFLLGLLLAIVYYLRRVMLLFVLALLFAYLLAPVVDLVHRFITWPRSRNYSLAIVYSVLIGLLILFGVLVGNRVAQQASTLATEFPALEQGLEKRLQEPGPPWLQPVKQYILEQVKERAAVLPLIQNAARHVLAVLSSAILIVLIPILSFFFLKDGKELRDQALGVFSPTRRVIWEDIAGDVHVLLGQFIRALVILALATFAVYGIFFSVAGVPYSVLLAAIAGGLECIPMFGPLAAAAIIVAVAVVTGYGHVLLILGFLGGYRIFQDYILSPHLMSSGGGLHPLLVIFGVLAGEEIAGVPGMFLSVPVLATLRVIYVRIQKARGAPLPITSPTSP